MNIIIPMAGLGKRLRPHTLTTAKPLLPIAGKPIVHRLVEDIARVCPEKIEIIGFILHPSFGQQVEDDLRRVAAEVGAEGKIYYQAEALGISHALLFAGELFKGKVIVAFADTLFRADFKLDLQRDGIIWVQQVKDPSHFGVVQLDEAGIITDMIEKPAEFVSDLAIIGVYFFKEGEVLRREMQYLIDNNIREKGEFQLTSALENMRRKGAKFIPGKVDEWLDCGNKDNMVQTNARYLTFLPKDQLQGTGCQIISSEVIQPVWIGNDVTIEHSTVGPFVSVGSGTVIKNSTVKNSIIQSNAQISGADLDNSMLGNFVNFKGSSADASLGDYSVVR